MCTAQVWVSVHVLIWRHRLKDPKIAGKAVTTGRANTSSKYRNIANHTISICSKNPKPPNMHAEQLDTA